MPVNPRRHPVHAAGHLRLRLSSMMGWISSTPAAFARAQLAMGLPMLLFLVSGQTAEAQRRVRSVHEVDSLADVTSGVDRLQFFTPGLSARVVCSQPMGPEEDEFCELSSGAVTILKSLSGFSGNAGQYDGTGIWYVGEFEQFPCGAGTAESSTVFLFKTDGAVQPVLKISGECGEVGISASYDIRVNPVTGTMLLAGSVQAYRGITSLGGIGELIEISGLPSIEMLLGGPPGPPIFEGPPGPPPGTGTPPQRAGGTQLAVQTQVTSGIERLELLLPGLSARLICSEEFFDSGEGTCEFSGGGETLELFPNGFSRGQSEFDGSGSMYTQIVEFDEECPSGRAGDTTIIRVTKDATIQPVLKIRGECGEEVGVDAQYDIRINPVTGSLILAGGLQVNRGFDTLGGVDELIEVSGLPSIKELLGGPPGPPLFEDSVGPIGGSMVPPEADGAIVARVAAPTRVQPVSAIDRLELFTPGLSARLICSVPISFPLDLASCPATVALGDEAELDGAGNWYISDSQEIDCPTGSVGEDSTIYMFKTDATVEPVLRIRGQCDGRDSVLSRFRVNAVAGTVALAVLSEGVIELFEIASVPALLDAIPHGPPGPPEFSGPPGPRR